MESLLHVVSFQLGDFFLQLAVRGFELGLSGLELRIQAHIASRVSTQSENAG